MILALIALLCLGALTLTGCYRKELPDSQKAHFEGISEPSAGTSVLDPTVPLNGAQALDVKLQMLAGELNLKAGDTTTYAAETLFEYEPASLRPEVTYEVRNETTDETTSGTVPTGFLSVEQPDVSDAPFGTKRNTWGLNLARDVPLSLNFQLGAGESNLDFAGMDVRDFVMEMGAGDATLEFGGTWDHSVRGEVKAGIGEVTIKVPSNVGVRIERASSGIGDFIADDGFKRDGDWYVNRAWGETTSTIEIAVQRGIGDVHLKTLEGE